LIERRDDVAVREDDAGVVLQGLNPLRLKKLLVERH
jgi:hypothetical protein